MKPNQTRLALNKTRLAPRLAWTFGLSLAAALTIQLT